MAAEMGHAEIISLLTGAGAQLEAKADLDVSAWLVVGDCIVHTHRSPYIESISSPSIAEMIPFISINYQQGWHGCFVFPIHWYRSEIPKYAENRRKKAT